MNLKSNIIPKIVAILLMLIGLVAMLNAWSLLVVGSIYSSKVLVQEIVGVVVCLAGYFLRRHIKGLEKEETSKIQAVQSAAEEPHK